MLDQTMRAACSECVDGDVADPGERAGDARLAT